MSSTDLRKIVIITYPLPEKKNGVESYNYYSSYVFLLTKAIQDKYQEAEILLKIPERNQDPHLEQMKFIRAAASDGEVDYIIVSPHNASAFYDEFTDMEDSHKLMSSRRVIFIDQGFAYPTEEQNTRLKTEHLYLPPYVQADWHKGGEVAAKSAFQYLKQSSITTPHIVILHGGPGSEQRVAGFIDFLETETEKPFYPTFYKFNAEYSKSTSRTFFASYLAETKKSKSKIDLIFCTNDEMGLGVRDVLIENRSHENCKEDHITFNPKIIGFDGILDFTLLINKEDIDFLYDTILVGMEDQINAIVNIISNHNRHKSKLKEKDYFFKSECKSYREEKGWRE